MLFVLIPPSPTTQRVNSFGASIDIYTQTTMSRPSSVIAPRNLSLTEELEKLEQSITLTLQGKDHYRVHVLG